MAKPIARKTDPDTSHEGAARITASGNRLRVRRMLQALLKKHPAGMTHGEMADALGLRPDQVWKRVSELNVREVGKREYYPGYKQKVWVLNEELSEELA